MTSEKMEKNLAFVNSSIEKFLNLYRNKYVLISGESVVGSFDTYEAAAEEGVKNYGLGGDFLVHYVTETAPVNFVSTALI